MKRRKLSREQLRAIFAKANGNYYVKVPDISSQYLGVGKTKKEAIKDAKDSLNLIFSDERDRKSVEF